MKRAMLLSLLGLTAHCTTVLAEPYFAVRDGLACASCHVNPTGGGLRNAFGNVYAQQQLPANPETSSPWTGTLAERFALGGNLRAAGSQTDLDDRDDSLDFGVERATLYAAATLNEHVSLYVDQQVAPGGSLNREAWLKFTRDDWYVKAGRMFLPYGWRLEDNTALVRQTTGISMLQGDDGVEFGYASGRLSAQLAVTNGAGGGPEQDDGKQVVLSALWMHGSWQAGLSALDNNTDGIDRTAYGLFGGVRTGPVAWLAEYNHIDSSSAPAGDIDQQVALLEANWLVRNGQNLKLTLEHLAFDENLDDQSRISLVYEYFPWPFAQIRAGIRKRDDDSDNPVTNSETVFLELHGYF